MKQLLTIAILCLISLPALAQRQHPEGNPQPVQEMISSLSAKQKRQLEAIDNERRAQLDAIRKELKGVRDSVHMYIDLYGDYSKQMNRLLERESALQLKMNKILYSTKVRIDKIITPEQYREMHEKMDRGKNKR